MKTFISKKNFRRKFIENADYWNEYFLFEKQISTEISYRSAG